jgi:hypothetical protein
MLCIITTMIWSAIPQGTSHEVGSTETTMLLRISAMLYTAIRCIHTQAILLHVLSQTAIVACERA